MRDNSRRFYMDPNQWGPDTWKFLHILTFQSHASIQELKQFFHNIKYLLPCPNCRKNYDLHVTQVPFPNSKKNIPKWLIKIHNRVNESVQKPIYEEDRMYDYWKEQSKHVSTSKELGIWTFIICSIHTHPGIHKITPDIQQSHEFFWKHLDLWLPKSLKDRTPILNYLLKYPILTVSIKYQYVQDVNEFMKQQHFSNILTKIKQRCKGYCLVEKKFVE